MDKAIKENIIFLSRNITNLNEILVYLLQHGIIGENEYEEVIFNKTTLEKNLMMLEMIQKKSWNANKNLFLEILRKTNNGHCADIVEGVRRRQKRSLLPPDENPKRHSGTKDMMISKWWPDGKLLTKSFYKRKIGTKSLVDELHRRIVEDNNRMVVISESADDRNFFGIGGIGKTFTAKWYANHYEDEYDHILWIDCGEGNFLQSFKKLAMELKVDNWDKFINVEDYARKSFEMLSTCRCLWIYDNAEDYKGKNGILKLLPRFQPTFYCLITSRSNEWGTKNIGYGKISDLILAPFCLEEGREYLKNSFSGNDFNYSDNDLDDICRYFVFLPLALNLAVATLKSGKISWRKYNSKALSMLKFGGFQEKISVHITITMDLILAESFGKIAQEILMIFGYIRSDDVPSAFFMRILNCTITDLNAAIDLLEKYSFITKTGKAFQRPYDGRVFNKIFGWDKQEVEMNLLSIHQSLQKIIRHNGRKAEAETLSKILNCDGFMNFKLIPFMKYADEELKQKFSKVKAELIDQEHLKNLIKEMKFQEAVHLAKFINEELMTKTTEFNYCVCLEKNGEFETAIKILENTSLELLKDERVNYDDIAEIELLNLEVEPTKDFIEGRLFVLYWKNGNKKGVKQILDRGKPLRIIHSNDSLNIVILILHSFISNYSLKSDDSITEIQLKGKTKTVELYRCSLDLYVFEKFCTEELILEDISFIRNGQYLKKLSVKDFVDLKHIKRLDLNLNEDILIDFTDDVTIEYLNLCDVKVMDWSKFNWNVQKLRLVRMPYVEKTEMKIEELVISNTKLDISCLPKEIRELTLINAEVSCSGECDLPNLRYLTLDEMNSSCLSYFRSVKLSHIVSSGWKVDLESLTSEQI